MLSYELEGILKDFEITPAGTKLGIAETLESEVALWVMLPLTSETSENTAQALNLSVGQRYQIQGRCGDFDEIDYQRSAFVATIVLPAKTASPVGATIQATTERPETPANEENNPETGESHTNETSQKTRSDADNETSDMSQKDEADREYKGEEQTPSTKALPNGLPASEDQAAIDEYKLDPTETDNEENAKTETTVITPGELDGTKTEIKSDKTTHYNSNGEEVSDQTPESDSTGARDKDNDVY
ncbi:hypothetical protein [Levilactobacillus brevis]|uniref:hypothetical protein n=1 Tax=Levilactobacillus brevis TaxID=1580 RepID=UPI000407678C|nr:hypothetical protein [Levilactobacillus brevis]